MVPFSILTTANETFARDMRKETLVRIFWQFTVSVIFSLTLGITASSATLLYAGGEDTDFICTGSGQCSVTTVPTAFRANWAREAYRVSGSISDPPYSRFAAPAFAPNSAVWIHAQYCQLYATYRGCIETGTSNNAQMLRVIDSAGNPTLLIRGTDGDAQLKISSRTSSGAFTDLATCPSILKSTLVQLDLYINYGVSGEIALYGNGVKICGFTGNVTNGDGATSINQVEFAAAYNGVDGNWSEVIVATTDTRGMSRFSAYTVGDGNSVQFSGTNVCSAIWGAAAFSDASYGYSDQPGMSHECTINGTVPSGAYRVLGLVMSARVLTGTTGPQHFAFLTRIAGTDYPSGGFAPLPAFSNFANYIQTTNPATGNPWSVSDFSSAGFNVGEKTLP